MKLIYLLYLLLFFYSFSSKSQIPSYCNWEGADCPAVKDFALKNKELIEEQAKLAQVSPAFFLAIVAPEISNYNYWQDQFECYMLETGYVSKGKEHANYSVGYFQMKPIFVEQLEYELKKRPELASITPSFQYHSHDLHEIRQMRVRRLRSTYWQLRYLMVYHRIVQLRFSNLPFQNTETKLIFFAAAYNTGYTHSSEIINKWMKIAWFPNYGRPPAYIYSQLAASFWKELKTIW